MNECIRCGASVEGERFCDDCYFAIHLIYENLVSKKYEARMEDKNFINRRMMEYSNKMAKMKCAAQNLTGLKCNTRLAALMVILSEADNVEMVKVGEEPVH